MTFNLERAKLILKMISEYKQNHTLTWEEKEILDNFIIEISKVIF